MNAPSAPWPVYCFGKANNVRLLENIGPLILYSDIQSSSGRKSIFALDFQMT